MQQRFCPTLDEGKTSIHARWDAGRQLDIGHLESVSLVLEIDQLHEPEVSVNYRFWGAKAAFRTPKER